MGTGFTSPVDIANRALQHCGALRIDSTLGFTEQSRQAAEISFCYDKLRQAELRRNVWTFSTRKAVLRPIDTNTMILQPALWQAGVTYYNGSIVTDINNQFWISKAGPNLGLDPTVFNLGQYPVWEEYFGPLSVSQYDSTATYYAGELVYTAPGDGTYNVYISQVNANAVDPSLPGVWVQNTTYFKGDVVVVYPAWSSLTTYSQGQTVTFTDGNVYSSLVNSNLNNQPNLNLLKWALVPILSIVSQPVPSTTTVIPITPTPVGEWSRTATYSLAFFVMFNGVEYVSLVSNNTGNLPSSSPTFWAALTGGSSFLSLTDLNIGVNPTTVPAAWSSVTTYAIGNQVYGTDNIIYTSVTNGNINNNPVSDNGVNWTKTGVLAAWTALTGIGPGNLQWLQVGGAAFSGGVLLLSPNIIYPLGSGPSMQARTRNLFRLPAGFLREAPQDPKAGSTSFLGAPSGLAYPDWEYEGKFIVSGEVRPIIYRYVADTVNVIAFDPMFCEGLAARIGLEVCETLTQSTEKIKVIADKYNKFMTEARTVNGIETGATQPPDDDYILARL